MKMQCYPSSTYIYFMFSLAPRKWFTKELDVFAWYLDSSHLKFYVSLFHLHRHLLALIFHVIHNQSASFTNKQAGGIRAESDCSKLP